MKTPGSNRRWLDTSRACRRVRPGTGRGKDPWTTPGPVEIPPKWPLRRDPVPAGVATSAEPPGKGAASEGGEGAEHRLGVEREPVQPDPGRVADGVGDRRGHA